MLFDGKALAETVLATLPSRIQALPAPPGLATVLIGENAASQAYVRSKRARCADLGLCSFHHDLPATVTQAEVLALIDQLNTDDRVQGILIQLPLPPHLDEQTILTRVHPQKDVDGFHPVNIGKLALKGYEPDFVPCTPLGVMRLLEAAKVRLRGAQAVVLGRSNIVGVPMALLLMNADATVTIAHSKTQDLAVVCRQADILIAAVGRAHLVKADWVKAGAVVIDVGINRLDDPTAKKGYRLVGDVDTEAVAPLASILTPVPGGVGPMTIAMLMENTVRAAEQRLK
jgi:5,10-methylene-tetrahydrofolate dehydrogenase/methenyl tetrahydrofolate cyclohydrolase